MINKAVTMLEMQDAMNRKVDEDWLDKNREWYRAVWIECAELMDHYGGWKWWKASSPDIEQVVLEIVDIWHFGLSMQITPARDYLSVATRLCDEWQADGFDQSVNVKVIMATNRQDTLDPALLRPGRFDRHITVDRPTLKGRIEMFKVHVRNVPLDDNVDIKRLAEGSIGLTGADIRNLVNEAALWATRNDKNRARVMRYIEPQPVSTKVRKRRRSLLFHQRPTCATSSPIVWNSLTTGGTSQACTKTQT